MLFLIIGVAVAVLAGIYVIVTYNNFISLDNSVKEAFATMDVYLKKRWDLVPNLVETVKGYTAHEKGTFENIVNLRGSHYDELSAESKIDINQQLTGALGKLFALAENYPDLKASQNFIQLSSELSQIENDIANSRKYYNAVAKNMNNSVRMFPSNIIASMFNFAQVKMFESAAQERENVKVSF